LCALGYDGAMLAFRDDLCACGGGVNAVGGGARAGSLHDWRWRLYLVVSDWELLMVRKLYTVAMAWNIDIEAVDAQVDVQVLLSKGECKWGLMEDAPGRAVFVGSVASAVVTVHLYPTAGLRESCVYLARLEVEMLAPHTICEYSMEEEEMRAYPSTAATPPTSSPCGSPLSSDLHPIHPWKHSDAASNAVAEGK
jgi:hypothetical protein